MKLILKEYLAGLKERNELDAVLPDLLSQLGLNVYSRPGRGTKQDGVDVAAVGALDGSSEKVYLFSIKAGDITRRSWDDDSMQSLRRSLNEILDTYISNRLPMEHRTKQIVICICCGGDIQEQIRTTVSSYCNQNSNDRISFEEWNGDKLAELIQSHFLREDLLPKNARSLLRKAIALLDEPEASHRHFSALIEAISTVNVGDDRKAITAVRQIAICQWILYSWCREAGNLESAYLSAELSTLHAWHVVRKSLGKTNKSTGELQAALESVISVYQQVCSSYLEKVVFPHASSFHGLSSAVRGRDRIDVNLRLFDVIGRLAVDGLWAYWGSERVERSGGDAQFYTKEAVKRADALVEVIDNNPALLLPIKDDQAIDVMLAMLLLTAVGNYESAVKSWLSEMIGRAHFSYAIFGDYPSTIDNYVELLERKKEDAFRKEATRASILFPTIAFWAALYGLDDIYSGVANFWEQKAKHCNFQYWYPDETSEENIYIDRQSHGMTLSHLPVNRSQGEYLEYLFNECEETPAFKELSAIKAGLWPLLLIVARYHRIPVPLELMKGLRPPTAT